MAEPLSGAVLYNLFQDISTSPLHPFEYHARENRAVQNMGGDNVPRVITDLSMEDEISIDTLQKLGYTYFESDDKWGISDFACDYIFINKKTFLI